MDELARLSRLLLLSMADEPSALFPQKALLTSSGIRRVGTNPLYSAISAIGLQLDVPSDGSTAGVPVDRTLDALCSLTFGKPSSPGLLGATIWALAVARDHRTSPLLEILERRFVARTSSSVDIGLVLAGLAAAFEAFPRLRDTIARSAAAPIDELLHRFSDRAQLFGGSSWALRPRRLLHWNMTSFASQVYSIHGLVQYARATETAPPQQILRAADRLIETQGPLGQWWWIYSLRTGAVVERYPVYSVHQDAMAFMALAPLQNLGLGSYDDELARGLVWVFGANELRAPLVDFDRTFISRSIQRHGGDADGIWGMSPSQRRAAMLGSWGIRTSNSRATKASELEILEEARPYHLGWVLYARSLISNW